VQIKKNQGCIDPCATVATSCGATAAQSHASLFPAQLALARWMYGGDTPHVHSCTHHIARAAWYDQAQARFQAWIDAGGFHLHEPEHTDSAIQDVSSEHRLAPAPDPAATRNPAWYDITRCRVTQDNDCSK
jgi:hypothetical protein